MAVQYRLQPPFLVVPEHQDFSDAWEFFCVKLLKLHQRTEDIYVRKPPESGVDLWYPAKRIAYQCKSVESGKSSDFGVTKAVGSYHAALTIQASLGWEQYSVGTNVSVTGASEATLRSSIPGVEILPESYWHGLCEKHSEKVARNFRQIVDIAPSVASASLADYLRPPFAEAVAAALGRDPFDIFVYTNRHETIFRLGVSADVSVGDLLHVLRAMFQLPKPRTIENEGISVSLSHSIQHEGSTLDLGENTLGQAGIGPGSIITYWTKIVWRDENEKQEFRGDVLHMVIPGMTRGSPLRSQRERADAAIEIYDRMVRTRFEAFEGSL